jgi:hypothetical protein
MSTATRPDPGSPAWRDRFLVMQPKAEPLKLIVHDALYDFDAYYCFSSHDELRHFVNQLRAGFVDIAPAGTIRRPKRPGP